LVKIPQFTISCTICCFYMMTKEGCKCVSDIRGGDKNMAGTTAKLNKEQIRTRRELLAKILNYDPDRPVFEELLKFYKNIFSQKPDLVVFMSRKSWCVVHLFLPLLKEEGVKVDEKKLTHDRMVHPWFAELKRNKPGKIKVFVVDDTLQTGRAVDECARRLIYAYNVNKDNLAVAVFAVADTGQNKSRINGKRYTVYPAHNAHDKPRLEVNWGGGNFYPKGAISAISYYFVEAIHACSEPYVGYIPAFRLPIKDVQEFLGAERRKEITFNDEPDIRLPGYLEQDDLRAPLNDPAKIGFYNITTHQMRQHDVEAFYFSLPDDAETFYLPALGPGGKKDLPFFPPKHALSIQALRFYLNSKTGFALIVPYLSLKDCHAEKEIDQKFPPKLRPLMREMCSLDDWDYYEGHIAAYRLLRFAACYLWGKSVLKRWFPKARKKEIVSLGGICSGKFLGWLNRSSVEQELKDIWTFFDPKEGNVCEKTQSLETYGDVDNILLSDMPDDKENYEDIIDQSLSFPAPVDYFSTAGMMFRNILTREHEMQYKYEAKADLKKNPLVEPFHGFPIHTFFSLLLLKFPKLETRRDVFTTVTLMLCDTGVAVTQLCQRDSRRGKVIGTVLFNGEQSFHMLAPVAPEYAHFLNDLPGMLLQFKDMEQRKKKFDRVRDEIRKYFKEKMSQGMFRRLSFDELMYYLDYTGKIALNEENQEQERGFETYSSLPGNAFFDRSELLFIELRKELTA